MTLVIVTFQTLKAEIAASEERSSSPIKRIKYDILEVKMSLEAIDKTVPANRLTTIISLLALAVEFGWPFVYLGLLKKIEELMDAGATVSSSNLPGLNLTLSEIPEDFAGIVSNIRKLIPTHTSGY
jgi:hypothetical protein